MAWVCVGGQVICQLVRPTARSCSVLEQSGDWLGSEMRGTAQARRPSGATGACPPVSRRELFQGVDGAVSRAFRLLQPRRKMDENFCFNSLILSFCGVFEAVIWSEATWHGILRKKVKTTWHGQKVCVAVAAESPPIQRRRHEKRRLKQIGRRGRGNRRCSSR